MSAKNKVTTKYFQNRNVFERIKEETNNNLAPELIPREKIKSQVTHKRRILSVRNKMAAFLRAIVMRLDITFLESA